MSDTFTYHALNCTHEIESDGTTLAEAIELAAEILLVDCSCEVLKRNARGTRVRLTREERLHVDRALKAMVQSPLIESPALATA